MLQAIKQYNGISSELRKRLNQERSQVGKEAKFKFYIANRNPDGQHMAGGEYLYPALWSLTPVTFNILDPGDQNYKAIALTDGMEREGLVEEVRLKRVQLIERDRGIKTLDLTIPEHIAIFELLLMHPKMEGGEFRDKNVPAMFARIDELKEAKNRMKIKEQRSVALMVATRMTEPEVRNFAAAMNWNELEDLEILKDKATELADKDPEFFKKFVDDPMIEYRALTRRAIDSNVISWVPIENKFIWTTNGSTIAMLERTEGDKYFDKMAEWFITHKTGQDTYKKIKMMISGK